MFSAAFIYILGVMIPGANFILVSRFAASSSIRAGVGATIGIAMVGLIFSASSVAGIALLIERFPSFSRFATVAGAIYLSYIAYLLMRSALQPTVGTAEKQQAVRQTTFRMAWRVGVLTNLTNMKTIVFMVSVFAEFLVTNPTLQEKTAVIAFCVSFEVLWYLGVALVFGQGVVQRFYMKYGRQIDAAMAVFLALFVIQSILSAK
jgi:threonine efflux protein